MKEMCMWFNYKQANLRMSESDFYIPSVLIRRGTIV